MAESSAINRSLFVLGQVVEALNTGAHRIPYRDSKMTRILQDSLGGQCVGMMIVNVAPGQGFLQDTHNTLNFATKSRDVVNKPVVNEVIDPRWYLTAAERMQNGSQRAHLAKPQRNGTQTQQQQQTSRAKRPRTSDSVSESDQSFQDGHAPHSRSSYTNSSNSKTRTKSGGAPRMGRSSDGKGSEAVHAVGANKRKGIEMNYAPDDKHIEELVSKKLRDLHKKSSTDLNERLTKLENQLGNDIKDDEVIDLLSPTTKLKNSKAWLSQARKFEKEGKLKEALTRYEHARQYAPNLRKLEAHISKLKKRISKGQSEGQHKSKSIASQDNDLSDYSDGDANIGLGQANTGMTLDESLSDPESPGAEKALRLNSKVSLDSKRKRSVPANDPANAKKRRRASAEEADITDENDPNKKPKKLSSSSLFQSAAISFKPNANGNSNMQHQNKLIKNKLGIAKKLKETTTVEKPKEAIKKKRIRLDKPAKRATTAAAMLEAETPFIFRVPDEMDLENSPHLRYQKQLPMKKLEFQPKNANSKVKAKRLNTKKKIQKMDISDSDDSDDGNASVYCPDLLSPVHIPSKNSKPRKGFESLDQEYEYLSDEIDPGELDGTFNGGKKSKKKRKLQTGVAGSDILATSTKSKQNQDSMDIDAVSSNGPSSPSEILAVLNSRQIKAIIKLKGIGKRRAEQIDQYIQLNGPMSDVDDLRNLAGFSSTLINNIKSSTV